ncbi:MAG: thioesterase family protein, partial [Actinomycetota bacterium]
DVPALGTPAVLALMERAACDAVASAMEDGATNVGVWAEIEHVAASKVGAEVVASAVLERADTRSLEFTCDTREGDRIVARGRHRRAIVDRGRFLERL